MGLKMLKRFIVGMAMIVLSLSTAQANTVAILDYDKSAGKIVHNHRDGVAAFLAAYEGCVKGGGVRCQVIYMGTKPGFVALARCADFTYWTHSPDNPEMAKSALDAEILVAHGSAKDCVIFGIYEDQRGNTLTRPDLLPNTSDQPKKAPTKKTQSTQQTKNIKV